MVRAEKNAIYILVFALSVFGSAHVMKQSLHSECINPYRIPESIGHWKGMSLGTDLGLLKSGMGAQDIVFRTYRNGIDVVTLYVAFYKDIDSANQVHAPEVCYPGQGWTIARDEVVVRKFGDGEARINRLIIHKENRQELVYHWWQTGDMIIPWNSANRVYQMIKSLRGQNPSTVWIRVSTDTKKDVKSCEESIERFSRELTPLIRNYFSRS